METIINNELFDVFMEWEKTSGLRIVAHDNSLSMPFIPYASNEYAASQKKLLIVGQEARDYPPFDDNWHKQQIDVNEYFESQLHGKKTYKYNRSAFWSFFRQFEHYNGWSACWNNIDKVHGLVDEKTKRLSCEIEKKLNGVVLSNNRTLFQNEVSILKPNAVIFITGPYYQVSMAESLKIDSNILLEHKPTVLNPCVDISEVVSEKQRVLWTYHPTFLRRRKIFDSTIEIIRKWLDNRV